MEIIIFKQGKWGKKLSTLIKLSYPNNGFFFLPFEASQLTKNALWMVVVLHFSVLYHQKRNFLRFEASPHQKIPFLTSKKDINTLNIQIDKNNFKKRTKEELFLW